MFPFWELDIFKSDRLRRPHEDHQPTHAPGIRGATSAGPAGTSALVPHRARRTWSSPADVEQDYANASIIAGNRVVFNIAGNNDRLVVKLNYRYGVGYIRFVGTHAEYDKIDAAKV